MFYEQSLKITLNEISNTHQIPQLSSNLELAKEKTELQLSCWNIIDIYLWMKLINEFKSDF